MGQRVWRPKQRMIPVLLIGWCLMSRWLTVDTHSVDSALRWHHFGQGADLPLLSSAFRMDGHAISAGQ